MDRERKGNEGEEAGEAAVAGPKAAPLPRAIARAIDLTLAGAVFVYHPLIGPLGAILYLLVADGLRGGQSIGKRLLGLRTISLARAGAPCDLRDSIIRNAVFALVIVAYVIVGLIPYLGKFVVFIAAVAVVVIESATAFNDELGLRFGDRVALTMVVEDKKD